MQIIYILIALLVGFFLGRASKKSFEPATPEKLEKLQKESKKALGKRTEKRKEAIIRMMQNSKQHHEELKACNLETERRGINRQDVEDLLGVSGQTALKYLNELEEEGQIKQIGVTGKDVYYMFSI